MLFEHVVTYDDLNNDALSIKDGDGQPLNQWRVEFRSVLFIFPTERYTFDILPSSIDPFWIISNGLGVHPDVMFPSSLANIGPSASVHKI